MEIPEFAQVDIFDLYIYFIPGSLSLILIGLFMPHEVTTWATGDLSTVLQLSFIVVIYILGVLVNGAAKTLEESYYIRKLPDKRSKENSPLWRRIIHQWPRIMRALRIFPKVDVCMDRDSAPEERWYEDVSISRLHLPGVLWFVETLKAERKPKAEREERREESSAKCFGGTPAGDGFCMAIGSEPYSTAKYVNALLKMRSELSTRTYYPFHKPAARSELFLSVWFILLLFVVFSVPYLALLLRFVIPELLYGSNSSRELPALLYDSHAEILIETYLTDPEPIEPRILALIISVSITVAYSLLILSRMIRKYEYNQMIRQLAADYYVKHREEDE